MRMRDTPVRRVVGAHVALVVLSVVMSAGALPGQAEPLVVQAGRVALEHRASAEHAWPGFHFPNEFILCGEHGLTLVATPTPPPVGFGNSEPLALGSMGATDAYLFRTRPPTLPPHCLSLAFPLNARRVVSWVASDSAYGLREPVLATVAVLFHEVFHAYQEQHFAPTRADREDWRYVALEQAFRIPDSIARSPAFQRGAARERALLAEALLLPPSDSLRSLLRVYLDERSARMAMLSVTLQGAEPHEERKEGSAQLVGYMSAFRAMGREEEDIATVVRWDLLNTPQFDAPMSSGGPYRRWHIYATGSAIGLLLDRLGLSWREELQDGETFLSLLTRAMTEE